MDLINKSIYQLKILGFINKDHWLTPFGLWCIYHDMNLPEIVTVLCGGSLYDVSIVYGVFDNKPKDSSFE